MKLYLTRNETAKLLGVTPQTVSNYVEKGLLVESSKRDPKAKAMRILRQSVETLLEEGYDVLCGSDIWSEEFSFSLSAYFARSSHAVRKMRQLCNE